MWIFSSLPDRFNWDQPAASRPDDHRLGRLLRVLLAAAIVVPSLLGLVALITR